MTESSKKRPSKSLDNSISSTPLKPSAKMVKVSDESDVSISKIFELVEDMNKKLAGLTVSRFISPGLIRTLRI